MRESPERQRGESVHGRSTAWTFNITFFFFFLPTSIRPTASLQTQNSLSLLFHHIIHSFMASTEGLVPITRSFLASYYDKYPFAPLSDDVSRISSEIRSLSYDLLAELPPSQGTLFSIHAISSVFLILLGLMIFLSLFF